MKIAKKELIYIFMVIITVFILIIISLEIPNIQRDIKANIKANMVRTISSVLDNFEKEFQPLVSNNPDKKLFEIVENDPLLQNKLEQMLSLIIADEIKYCYVVYRDNEGKFRFMLDGSKQDKAEFGRKFDIESDVWKKAYQTQKPQLIEQTDITTLWITHLHPIVINGEMHGIIAVDFSLEGYQRIIDILQPLQKYIWIFLGLMILGIFVSSVQYLFYRLSQRQVFIDPLTGIYNRNFLNDVLGTLDYQKYAIAMMDLDKFKIVNDTYGHDIGDEVLRSVAATLNTSIREYDKLIRYGGEEFILFISMRDTDEAEVLDIMNRLRNNIESLCVQTGIITIKPTISIGLNCYTSHFKNEHDAISIADKMLYEAKRTGRNKIVSYSPSLNHAHKLINSLNVHHVKEAIEEKRLFCEYQPIIHLNTQKIIGYEALIRIRDRDGKIIYPGMFLPNISHSNIYKELTLELLRINFQKIHKERCFISLNLNLTDILDDDIYATVLHHLTDVKQEARYLTFELLEEEQITNLDLLKERISTIRSFGSKISIDDFGSGYSNFSHIFALDIDIIKIDGSLIKEINTSDVSHKLVESLVAFARASDKRIVAEFIHSPEVLKSVMQLGISCGQGFHLGKPSETLATKVSNC